MLLVDDIVDTGLSMAYGKRLLTERHASGVRTCALLDKPGRRQVDVAIDFVGFEIPDVFVVGYGIDYAEQYRYLPYIGKLSLSLAHAAGAAAAWSGRRTNRVCAAGGQTSYGRSPRQRWRRLSCARRTPQFGPFLLAAAAARRRGLPDRRDPRSPLATGCSGVSWTG